MQAQLAVVGVLTDNGLIFRAVVYPDTGHGDRDVLPGLGGDFIRVRPKTA
jgi:hypothetical protein